MDNKENNYFNKLLKKYFLKFKANVKEFQHIINALIIIFDEEEIENYIKKINNEYNQIFYIIFKCILHIEPQKFKEDKNNKYLNEISKSRFFEQNIDSLAKLIAEKISLYVFFKNFQVIEMLNNSEQDDFFLRNILSYKGDDEFIDVKEIKSMTNPDFLEIIADDRSNIDIIQLAGNEYFEIFFKSENDIIDYWNEETIIQDELENVPEYIDFDNEKNLEKFIEKFEEEFDIDGEVIRNELKNNSLYNVIIKFNIHPLLEMWEITISNYLINVFKRIKDNLLKKMPIEINFVPELNIIIDIQNCQKILKKNISNKDDYFDYKSYIDGIIDYFYNYLDEISAYIHTPFSLFQEMKRKEKEDLEKDFIKDIEALNDKEKSKIKLNLQYYQKAKNVLKKLAQKVPSFNLDVNGSDLGEFENQEIKLKLYNILYVNKETGEKITDYIDEDDINVEIYLKGELFIKKENKKHYVKIKLENLHRYLTNYLIPFSESKRNIFTFDNFKIKKG